MNSSNLRKLAGSLFLPLIVGFGLRIDRLEQVGLSHFDEGIYALEAWTGSIDGFYSPPLFPWAGWGVFALLGGPSDLGLIAVSVAFGTAAISLAWWVAGYWFGPRSGTLAAWLVAVDGSAIAFSRAGLTDAMFASSLVLAVHLGLLGAVSSRWRATILGGVAAGFTWNVKYNGVMAPVLLFVILPGHRRRQKTLHILIFSTIALFLYLPWATWFHVEHGYASLVRHQRGYFQGLSAIWENWQRAVECHASFANGLGALAIAGATMVRARRPSASLVLLMVVACGFPQTWLLPLLILGVIGAIAPPAASGTPRWIWCWAGLLLLVAPALYSPYYRLWLPTVLVINVLAAAGLDRVLNGWPRQEDPVQPRTTPAPTHWVWAACTLVLAGVVAGSQRTHLRAEAPAGYRTIAANLAPFAKSAPGPLRCLVRPPLVFYLATQGVPLARLAGTADDLERLRPGDILLVDAVIADSPAFRDALERSRTRFRVLAKLPVVVSKVTLLDRGISAAELERARSDEFVEVLQRQ